MSRYLATALKENELNLRRSIAELEDINGHQSHDVRLISEVMSKLAVKIKDLGLDPQDTTPEELYYTLLARLKEDDHKLEIAIRTLAADKVNASADPSDGLMLLLNDLKLPSDCFKVKASVMKNILKRHQPHQVMKSLGYRSLDSLVKREPLALIVIAIRLIESKSFIDSFNKSYKSLKPTDFENKPLTILIQKSKRWSNLLSKLIDPSVITLACDELGSIAILPIGQDLRPGQISAITFRVLSEINRVLSMSTFLKVIQVHPDFGQKVYKVATSEPVISSQLLGKSLPWRVIQSILPETIDLPYLKKSDFKLSKLLDKLCDKFDFLSFWKSTDLIGLVDDDRVVSLNLIDVAHNLYFNQDFEDQLADNFRSSLWLELIKKYVSPKLAIEAITNDLEL